MTFLSEHIKSLKIGDIQEHENLAIYPLIMPEPREQGYLLLDGALQRGVLEIREVSDAGVVNEILVKNGSDSPVLILDGEILTGAKQDRVVNASIMVGPKVEIKIPVSCVEKHRWHYTSEGFTGSPRFSYANLRAKKSSQVAENLMACMSFSADQGAIWEEVDGKRARMGTESATGAVNDIFDSHADRLARYRDAFHLVEGQVGMAVFIGGKFVCLDSFDSQESLRQLFEKMIESYALDALEQPGNKKEITAGAVESLLKKIASAETKTYPSAGLGEDLRFSGEGLLGSCLMFEGRVIHLAVFEKTGDGQRRRTSLSSLSRRRRDNF
ncbi:MAG: hypothetical protein K6T65_03765 [Peptococcaceae bacterium]|nr:hypothetical protein [Peptococcaceae bacterium]